MILERHIPERRKKRLDKNYNFNLKVKSFFHIKHDEDKYFQHKLEYNWDEEPKIIPYYMEKCKKTKLQALEIIDKIDAKREKLQYRLFNLMLFLGGTITYLICLMIFISVFPSLAQYQTVEIVINTLKFSFDDLYVAGIILLLFPAIYYNFQEFEMARDRRILAIERDILYAWLKEPEFLYS